MPKEVSGLSRLIGFNAALAKAAADAVDEGYNVLKDAVANGDLEQPWYKNPLLQGSVQGWTAALSKGADGFQDAAMNYLWPASALEAAAREILERLNKSRKK
jgi:hypothetical protein